MTSSRPGVALALPPLGTRVAGRYVLLAERGSGMMGVVFEADDQQTGLRVALKILRPEVCALPTIAERLHREGQIVAKLQSPHIVKVFDVGTTEAGLPYFTMELLEGHDLMAVLDAGRTLPVGEGVGLIRQACAGLAEAHAMGIIHRDLKPQNLFVSKAADGTTALKILDFGVSKVVGSDAELTTTESSLGTPLYMSPEQVRSPRDVDERTDVWALGVVLFELVSGRPPFRGETAHGVIASIIANPALQLRQVMPQAPADLEVVLAATLRKDPGERIQSALALRDALAPFDPSFVPPSPELDPERTMLDMPAIQDPPAGASPVATVLGAPMQWQRPREVAQTITSQAPLAAPPSGAAGHTPQVRASRGRTVAIAAGALLAAIGLIALIWGGLQRRKTATSTTVPDRPSAPKPSERGRTFAEVLVAATGPKSSRWEPCILRELDSSIGAILPDVAIASALSDVDPKLRAASPPFLRLRAGPSAAAPSQDALFLEPLTPLFPALKTEAIPVLIVTDEAFYVGLLGDRLYDDVSTDEAQSKLRATLVKSAAGWVVAAEGDAPISRVARALTILGDTNGPVALAIPVASPAIPSAAHDCESAASDGARPLSSAEASALKQPLAALTADCARDFPWVSGRGLRVLVTPAGGPSLPAKSCVEWDETGSAEVRTCVRERAEKLAPSLASTRPPRATRIELTLTGPRVRPLCAP